MKITALYFSGTGNTKFAVDNIEKFFNEKDCVFNSISIEKWKNEMVNLVRSADLIIFAYPVYGSIAPKIMREYMRNNHDLFIGKNAAVIVTQLMFSGDGGAFGARILREYGIRVLDIEHFNMPSNLSDADFFKIKNGKENAKKISSAQKKIIRYCGRIYERKFKRTGDNFFSRCLGAIQAVPFIRAEARYRTSLNIDYDKCVFCKLCSEKCPTGNLRAENGKMLIGVECTLCYRCVNLCPEKAISFLKIKRPSVQYKGPC